MQSLSHVQLFVTPQTVAHQAPLSMGFPSQEYASELPFPPPGDLPNPGAEAVPFATPALAGGLLSTGSPGKQCCGEFSLPDSKTCHKLQLPRHCSFDIWTEKQIRRAGCLEGGPHSQRTSDEGAGSCIGESMVWSLVGCHLWGRTESDTTEATQQQQLAVISNFRTIR